MSYTPPSSAAADFDLSTGGAYTPPSSAAADFDLSATGGAVDPSGTLAATLSIDGSITATFTLPTFTGTLAATLALDGSIAAVHARTATMSATLPMDGSIAGLHPRYRLHGELRDGGALVTSPRRVRAHKRSNGALVAEVDTGTGVFDIEVGYALDEFYVVPIDLSSDAVDWVPPVANRVLSVLVAD